MPYQDQQTGELILASSEDPHIDEVMLDGI
jgi:hypothetical protein